MNEKFWGSEEGISEQKEFMAQLPQGWIRLLQRYKTESGEVLESYLGDEYEFRKVEKGVETQAIRLHYDWEEHWHLMIAKEYQSKDNKIVKVDDFDHYRFKTFAEARQKALELVGRL